jgi:hypothetical protein
MKAVFWMTAATTGAWGVASLLAGGDLAADLALGMFGPLVAAAATWLLIAGTPASDGARLQKRLLQGFGLKIVAFAAYVAVMLRVVHVQTGPFVAAFTTTFLVLHLTEAVLLQRRTAPRQVPSTIS